MIVLANERIHKIMIIFMVLSLICYGGAIMAGSILGAVMAFVSLSYDIVIMMINALDKERGDIYGIKSK